MGAWLKQCFGTSWQTDLMIIALVVLMPAFLIFMYRVQRDVKDLNFADWFRGPNGKASWKEAQGIGGFVVGTWCMIYVTLAGKVPDGYALLFLIYLAVCAGIPTAVAIINRMYPGGGQPAPLPNQQIKVDAPADASVNVTTGPQSGTGA
jgi:ABC-type phosphate transport system permease subunit